MLVLLLQETKATYRVLPVGPGSNQRQKMNISCSVLLLAVNVSHGRYIQNKARFLTQASFSYGFLVT